ncbi:NAD(P)H-hydrate dehydratase [Limnohabitans sp. G3-2]|uniref:NAD(P)H-hydrate dehydratase n=1 Tax=Limnohabitans sp. G3-2 TaxID=1100711 RepID=UPI000C1ECFF9|nr:NAD(P)H-hydrate dehydratase [Limnohabitans sp. G3-2]PIT73388.1 bifunctional ADP-dependent NAD(P)H-hydrate dehydratase/NAD(P)H-hydrate epimerase [Limnohabitans sp. G3-2]
MSTLQSLSSDRAWPIYGRDGIRALEALLQAPNPVPLMQQAGLAAAQLAMAVAPHAQRIWVAAGPGNNGGDGLEAAVHLHQWGKNVAVGLLGRVDEMPTDARAAWQRAHTAGVPLSHGLPSDGLKDLGPHDLIMDALLGIGGKRPLDGALLSWVQAINSSMAMVLALDAPTGLDADSGAFLGPRHDAHCIKAQHTLTFMAAKPGLFMGHGRDVCGHLWLADLGFRPSALGPAPAAWLNPASARPAKSHASHKGSFGDVAVIGGEADVRGMGMTGAAVLAATSALHAGAGRVILSLLSGQASHSAQADLMQRDWQSLDLEKLHVVCGCGGGQSVQQVLPAVLQRSMQLVLDADGLNAVSQVPQLQALLRQRAPTQATVLTPHPLEAARLLKTSTQEVQSERLAAAQTLMDLFQCTVILKGSGTVIASPGQTPRINPTGNGRLAVGGTGDVLAGLVGARMAQGYTAFEAACMAVAQHGQVADQWPAGQALTASGLAMRLS